MPDAERTLGEFGARIAAVESGQVDLERAIGQVTTDVHAIRIMFAEARGGWKAVLAICAAVGGIIAFVVDNVLHRAR
jgi:hypothetical protein